MLGDTLEHTHPRNWWPPAKDCFVALATTRKRLNIILFLFDFIYHSPIIIIIIVSCCRRDSCAHKRIKKRCLYDSVIMWGTRRFPFSSNNFGCFFEYFSFLPASRSHTLLWFGLTYSEKRFLFLISRKRNDLIALVFLFYFFFFWSEKQFAIHERGTRNCYSHTAQHGTWFSSCRSTRVCAFIPIVSSVSSFARAIIDEQVAHLLPFKVEWSVSVD